MAIARDTSTAPANASGTSTSFSHTCSGTDRFLTVATFHGWTSSYTAATNVAVTYNGTSMTLGSTSQYRTYVMYTRHWYLANPDTGSNTVSITWTGSVGMWRGSVSYTGVHQTTPVVGTNTTYSANNVTSISCSIDVGSNTDCWWTSVALLSNCLAASTSGTNVIATTPIQAADDGIALGDSDGTIGTGSQTGGWSSNNLNGTNHMVIMPSASAPTAVYSPFYMFGGV